MSDGRQPEVDFLHHWGAVWLKLSGKSSLKEKRNSAIQVCKRQGIEKGRRPHFRMTCVAQKRLCLRSLLLANNSNHCWMLHVASVSTPCCMLLRLVGSLKRAKLFATSKRTQQLQTMLGVYIGQQCCVRLLYSVVDCVRTHITSFFRSQLKHKLN